jgi:hypothetical protein
MAGENAGTSTSESTGTYRNEGVDAFNRKLQLLRSLMMTHKGLCKGDTGENTC